MFIDNECFIKSERESNRFILDTSEIHFSFDTLNCSPIECYKILQCKRKVLSKNQDVFIVNHHINILKKYDTKIQTLEITDAKLSDCISNTNGVLPLEIIITKILNKHFLVNESNLWIYFVEHSENVIKIIYGLGDLIILSRKITRNQCQDGLVAEFMQNAHYMKRYGFKNELSVFSNFDEIILYCNENNNVFHVQKVSIEILCQKLKLEKTDRFHDVFLRYVDLNDFNYLFSNNSFYIFLSKYYNKISIFLAVFIMILGVACFCAEQQTSEVQKRLLSIEKYKSRIDTESLQTVIDYKNYQKINALYELMKLTESPNLLFEIAQISLQNIIYEIKEMHFETNGLTIKASTLESDIKKIGVAVKNKKAYKIKVEKMHQIPQKDLSLIFDSCDCDNNIDKRQKMVDVIICIQKK